MNIRKLSDGARLYWEVVSISLGIPTIDDLITSDRREQPALAPRPTLWAYLLGRCSSPMNADYNGGYSIYARELSPDTCFVDWTARGNRVSIVALTAIGTATPRTVIPFPLL